MQILLANAKIMFEKADRKPLSTPLFQSGNAIMISSVPKRCQPYLPTMVRHTSIFGQTP